jgi:uncharacterized membrane protein (DUF2068 family)
VVGAALRDICSGIWSRHGLSLDAMNATRPEHTTIPLAEPVERQPDRMLRLIAVFKFCKAALLLAVGLGALRLLDPEVAVRAQRWVAAVAANSDRRIVQQLIGVVSGLNPRSLGAIAIGAFAYATLFVTEGIGLWRGKRWAEYLTVVATLSLVPLEVFEIIRRASTTRVMALLVNLVVAGYLIWLLRRSRAGERPSAEQPRAPRRDPLPPLP